MKKNILIIFKEKKEDRIFDFYLERKFSKEFNVNILYINQYFYLTTKNIIKKINEIKIFFKFKFEFIILKLNISIFDLYCVFH